MVVRFRLTNNGSWKEPNWKIYDFRLQKFLEVKIDNKKEGKSWCKINNKHTPLFTSEKDKIAFKELLYG